MIYHAVIIDDEPWTREAVWQLGDWKALGLEVVGEASDGDLGLQLIRQLRPEIVLTDVRMPYLSGIDLVSRMRGEHNNAQVIFISGYDDPSFIRSALKLDATDYLLKPIRQDELNAQLRRCVERLDAARKQPSAVSETANGFLAPSFVKGFYALREQLIYAMNARDADLVMQKLGEMEAQVNACEASASSGDLLIQLYYMLTAILQKYIVESGYMTDAVFDPYDASFVFSRDTRVKDVIAQEKKLYRRALERVGALMHDRSRLDMTQVLEYVKTQFSRTFTLDETAAHFNVSREYLSKMFKETYGECFSEYVTRLRMERAKRLITEYNTPISDAGAAVGYRDPAHFYKVFKRYFGMTPGQMRDGSKNNKQTQ